MPFPSVSGMLYLDFVHARWLGVAVLQHSVYDDDDADDYDDNTDDDHDNNYDISMIYRWYSYIIAML